MTVHVYACTIRTMKLMSLPCYCATLRQAARAVTVLYEGILGDSGLHATQFTALQFLDAAPNLTTTELAEALGVDQTTATRTLALIKKAGLASDTVGEDRRQRHWALSAQGRALLRKLKPRWEAAQDTFEETAGTDARQGAERRTDAPPVDFPRVETASRSITHRSAIGRRTISSSISMYIHVL